MKISLLLLFSIISLMTSSQILEKHRWENRVLLIISQESNTDAVFPEAFVEQHKKIKDSLQGLIDRKLVIYEIFPSEYRYAELEKGKESKWLESSSLYKIYNKENIPFKVVLIGLDGGIKETKDTVISSKELFAIIDGMPMRRRELNRKE